MIGSVVSEKKRLIKNQIKKQTNKQRLNKAVFIRPCATMYVFPIFASSYWKIDVVRFNSCSKCRYFKTCLYNFWNSEMNRKNNGKRSKILKNHGKTTIDEERPENLAMLHLPESPLWPAVYEVKLMLFAVFIDV